VIDIKVSKCISNMYVHVVIAQPEHSTQFLCKLGSEMMSFFFLK
jgi:hypothetical protein